MRKYKTTTNFADFDQTSLPSNWSFLSPNDMAPTRTETPTGRSQSFDPPIVEPTPHQSNSPASSYSSVRKTASSTNLAAESSPASSRSAQEKGQNNNNPSPGNTTIAGGHAPSARLSKAKMTLLNPMSLLSRRRTSQGTETIPDIPLPSNRTLNVPAMNLPEGYDPRIKGKGVHDFNAPRPKRNHSTNDMVGMAKEPASEEGSSQEASRRSSIPAPFGKTERRRSSEKEHTPVFVEHFDDEEPGPAQKDASAVHRESLANSGFLARMSKHIDFDAADFSIPPPQQSPPAQRQTNDPPQNQRRQSQQHTQTARNSKTTDASSYRVSSDQSTARSSLTNDTRATSPPPSPHRDAQGSTFESSLQPNSQLKHFSSVASQVSRFSFQLNSDRCIEQEKALEDKHKQKDRTPASKHASVADSRFDELEEYDMDYDDMDDGGYEEQIPMVNTEDMDEDSFAARGPRFSLSTPIHSLEPPNLQPDSRSYSSTSTSPSEEDTIRVGQEVDQGYQKVPTAEPTSEGSTMPQRTSTHLSTSTDDMYFDDGVIDQPLLEEQGPTDESLLDSPIRSKHASDTTEARQPQDSHSGAPTFSNLPKIYTTDLARPSTSLNSHSRQPFSFEKDGPLSDQARQNTSRSEGLSAYHNALASAASKAARDGKFERNASVTTASSRYTDESDGARTSLADDGQHREERSLQTESVAPDDGFEVPGDDEEDTIVAAANAEVLASEDSDYYGREFGFYSSSSSKEAEMYNGGYFGAGNMNRSNVGREPDLTPITERSEYSTRNSFISLASHGLSSAFPSSATRERESSFTGPGLKDLAASVGMDEDDMSLSQLMKLRKETFGSSHAGGPPGSAGSNRSSVAGQTASSSGDSPTSAHSNSNSLSGSIGNLRSSHHLHHSNPSFNHPVPPGSAHQSIEDLRLRSGSSQGAIAELPEREEEEAEAFTSPKSPEPRPHPLQAASLVKMRRESSGNAEQLAQEYSGEVQSPLLYAKGAGEERMSPSDDSRKSSAGPPAMLPLSEPAVSPSLSPDIRSGHRQASAQTYARASLSPTQSPDASQSPLSPPMPPSEMMAKFSSRPPPDAYRKSWQPGTGPMSAQGATSTNTSSADSVAYVQEFDPEVGQMRWYLERRRKRDNGELLIISREPVEGGRI
ncbi:MAG: hypothetical protein M1831_006854 [Alyxoria varia]|nr:MAG: hypothetical protein M1831_006854 [Alyxoria varia]